MTSFFCWGRTIWINFADWCRITIDCGDMVEIETRSKIPIWRTVGRIFSGMSSQSHVSHCMVKEFHLPYCSPYFIFCFLNAVWALASGGFRIVFDTFVGLVFCLAESLRVYSQASRSNYSGYWHDFRYLLFITISPILKQKGVMQIADKQACKRPTATFSRNFRGWTSAYSSASAFFLIVFFISVIFFVVSVTQV